MLMKLITYVANDGDFIELHRTSNAVNHSSPHHNNTEEELVSLEPMDISNLSKSQHEHVNDLLGDAMEESGEEKQKKGNVKILSMLYFVTKSFYKSILFHDFLYHFNSFSDVMHIVNILKTRVFLWYHINDSIVHNLFSFVGPYDKS